MQQRLPAVKLRESEEFKGVKVFAVYCEHSKAICESLIPFEPTLREFQTMFYCFNGHPLKDIFWKKEKHENELKQILEASTLIKPEVRSHFLSCMKKDTFDLIDSELSGKEEKPILHKVIGYPSEREPTMLEKILAAHHLKTLWAEIIEGLSSNCQSRKLSLNPDKRGAKTDIIRVLDALCELRFFTDDKGQIAPKGKVMATIGEVLGDDFSNFESILSQSYNNTRLETNLSVFAEMQTKIQKKYLQK